MAKGGFDWMTALEVAAGWVPGYAEGGMARRPPAGGVSPRHALERAILPALLRSPCVVSFSGGRDSSAVLAVAADLARREGLPPPLPVTKVYPGVAETDETSWQELVIRHLGLAEWTRLAFADGAVAPRRVRRQILKAQVRQELQAYSWLRPAARDAFAEAILADRLREPFAWHRSIRWMLGRRTWRIGSRTIALLAREAGVGCVVHPLHDEGFVDALAPVAGRTGFTGRRAAMTAVSGPPSARAVRAALQGVLQPCLVRAAQPRVLQGLERHRG